MEHETCRRCEESKVSFESAHQQVAHQLKINELGRVGKVDGCCGSLKIGDSG